MASLSLLTITGFLFLTFNCGMALYRSDGDVGTVMFVVASYSDLVALFFCLRWYERLDPNSNIREKLKIAVWLLTAGLTVMFTYKVAEIMPLAIKVVVWGMAAATTCGGFYAFFVYDSEKKVVAAAIPIPVNETE